MAVFRSFLGLVIVFGTVSPAAAQIYSWREADGKLVLSDRPRSGKGSETTYDIHGASTAGTNTKASAKSAPFEAAISEHASRQGVAVDLVRAVIQVESAFNPSAVSDKGAMGLMQLMPYTAKSLNVENAFDPRQNIDAGVRHLKSLLENYNGNVELSLAAYNAGSGAVRRSGGVPPFRETRDYVKKITELYRGTALRPRLVETRDAEGHRVFSNNE
jgi:soluble lytic murein transglycosylase-like protein